MKLNHLFRLSMIGGIILILSFSLVISVLLFLIFTKSDTNDLFPQTTEDYRLTTFDRQKNEITTDFASIPLKKMEQSPYNFLFQSTEEKLFLVSRFEDDVYQCTGTCYCDEERRFSGVALEQTFLVFLAGLGGIAIHEMAERFFTEECQKSLAKKVITTWENHEKRNQMKKQKEKACPPDKVVSEVDKCEKVPSEKKAAKPKPKHVDGEILRFMCRGICTKSKRQEFEETFTDLKDVRTKKYVEKYKKRQAKKQKENDKLRVLKSYYEWWGGFNDYMKKEMSAHFCRMYKIQERVYIRYSSDENPMRKAKERFFGQLRMFCFNAKLGWESTKTGFDDEGKELEIPGKIISTCEASRMSVECMGPKM